MMPTHPAGYDPSMRTNWKLHRLKTCILNTLLWSLGATLYRFKCIYIGVSLLLGEEQQSLLGLKVAHTYPQVTVVTVMPTSKHRQAAQHWLVLFHILTYIAGNIR